MSRCLLERIRDAVTRGEYDLTFHAVEEMAEDKLDIHDVEAAVISGLVVKIETDDPRGSRYTIVGLAVDRKTRVGVVGRFKGSDVFLVITVYEVTESER